MYPPKHEQLRFKLQTMHYLIACCCAIYTIAASPLDDVLTRYETLQQSQFQHQLSKRSAESEKNDARHVRFDTQGQHFHMFLELRQNLLSPNFRVVSVDKHNNEEEVPLDLEHFYRGVLVDEPASEVHAFWEDDGTMTATIKTDSDVYYIEPSWRHLPESNNYSMISYRASDMTVADDLGDSHGDNSSYCGFVRVDQDESLAEEQKASDSESSEGAKNRAKRASATKNTCPLLLVADYRFVTNMGQGKVSRTAIYLIGLIERVDTIYKGTDFGEGFESGMGFEIKELRIHKDPSEVAGGLPHYNMETDHWSTKELLDAFSSYDESLSQYCLAHLFTALVNTDGILGLSYVASTQRHNPGGICSEAYYKDKHKLYLNTGWSSSLNRYKRRLLTQEADLVTTHELGHNWGSEHDPDTTECSPSAMNKGKYIMYTYSVSGYDPNNKKFSPCSRRSMGAVLAAKSDICFQEKLGTYCGNSLLEDGEECDGGDSMKLGNDGCCNMDCTLRDRAICSDVNLPCCHLCAYASPNTVCQQPHNNSCEGPAKCTGQSATCPPPPAANNGSTCQKTGTCHNGQCVPLCESKGWKSCICDQLLTSCKWCCRRSDEDECSPYQADNPVNLPEGMPCIQGYCDEHGVCQKQIHDLVQRLWNIVENITPDTLVQFMRANIVGTVIVLSLLIWIPASCVISYLDSKKEREEDETLQWLNAQNRSLVQQNDMAKIRTIQRPIKRSVRSTRLPGARQLSSHI